MTEDVPPTAVGVNGAMAEGLPPAAVGVRAADENRGPVVPYMSFQGFRNLLDRLKSDGLPQVFDASFFPQYSGSLIAQIRGTLKFFDLIDDDKRPTPTFGKLASAEEPDRINILRGLVLERYADALALGDNATQGQLADVFRSTGLSGASITKAITFYVGLAEYVDLPVSPYFKKGKIRSSSAGGGSRSSRRRRSSSASDTQPVQVPQSTPSPMDQKRSAYIDLLMKLATQSGEQGEVQDKLLDRLERALGYETPSGVQEE